MPTPFSKPKTPYTTPRMADPSYLEDKFGGSQIPRDPKGYRELADRINLEANTSYLSAYGDALKALPYTESPEYNERMSEWSAYSEALNPLDFGDKPINRRDLFSETREPRQIAEWARTEGYSLDSVNDYVQQHIGRQQRLKRDSHIKEIDSQVRRMESNHRLRYARGVWGAGKRAGSSLTQGLMLMSNPFMLATLGEEETQAVRQAVQQSLYLEPDGLIDQMYHATLQNIPRIGAMAATAGATAPLAAIGTAGKIGGHLLSWGVLGSTSGASSYLDFLDAGVPRDEAMLKASAIGVGVTAIGAAVGPTAGKIGKATGLSRLMGTPDRIERYRKLFGIMGQKGDVGQLYRAIHAKNASLKGVDEAVKGFLGASTRSGAILNAGKEFGTAAFEGGVAEWFQELLEYGVTDQTLRKHGLEGIWSRHPDGTVDIGDALNKLEIGFLTGAFMEGFTGGVGAFRQMVSQYGNASVTQHIVNRIRSGEFDAGAVVLNKDNTPIRPGQDLTEDSLTVTPSQFSRSMQDFLARHTVIGVMHRHNIAENNGTELTGDNNASIWHESLQDAVSVLMNNPTQAALLEYGDGNIEQIDDSTLELTLNDAKTVIRRVEGGLRDNANAIFYQQGDTGVVQVDAAVYDKLVQEKFDQNTILVSLYNGSTLAHEVIHALEPILGKAAYQQLLDTLPARTPVEGRSEAVDSREQLAEGMEGYRTEHAQGPLSASLGDVMAIIDTKLHGKKASPENIRRVFYRQVEKAMHGKGKVDMSFLTKEADSRAKAATAEQVDQAASEMAADVMPESQQEVQAEAAQDMASIDDSRKPVWLEQDLFAEWKSGAITSESAAYQSLVRKGFLRRDAKGRPFETEAGLDAGVFDYPTLDHNQAIEAAVVDGAFELDQLLEQQSHAAQDRTGLAQARQDGTLTPEVEQGLAQNRNANLPVHQVLSREQRSERARHFTAVLREYAAKSMTDMNLARFKGWESVDVVPTESPTLQQFSVLSEALYNIPIFEVRNAPNPFEGVSPEQQVFVTHGEFYPYWQAILVIPDNMQRLTPIIVETVEKIIAHELGHKATMSPKVRSALAHQAEVAIPEGFSDNVFMRMMTHPGDAKTEAVADLYATLGDSVDFWRDVAIKSPRILDKMIIFTNTALAIAEKTSAYMGVPAHKFGSQDTKIKRMFRSMVAAARLVAKNQTDTGTLSQALAEIEGGQTDFAVVNSRIDAMEQSIGRQGLAQERHKQQLAQKGTLDVDETTPPEHTRVEMPRSEIPGVFSPEYLGGPPTGVQGKYAQRLISTSKKYQARGMSKENADRLARRVIKKPSVAYHVLADKQPVTGQEGTPKEIALSKGERISRELRLERMSEKQIKAAIEYAGKVSEAGDLKFMDLKFAVNDAQKIIDAAIERITTRPGQKPTAEQLREAVRHWVEDGKAPDTWVDGDYLTLKKQGRAIRTALEAMATIPSVSALARQSAAANRIKGAHDNRATLPKEFTGDPDPAPMLTKKEAEAVRLMAAVYSNAAIAAEVAELAHYLDGIEVDGVYQAFVENLATEKLESDADQMVADIEKRTELIQEVGMSEEILVERLRGNMTGPEYDSEIAGLRRTPDLIAGKKTPYRIETRKLNVQESEARDAVERWQGERLSLDLVDGGRWTNVFFPAKVESLQATLEQLGMAPDAAETFITEHIKVTPGGTVIGVNLDGINVNLEKDSNQIENMTRITSPLWLAQAVAEAAGVAQEGHYLDIAMVYRKVGEVDTWKVRSANQKKLALGLYALNTHSDVPGRGKVEGVPYTIQPKLDTKDAKEWLVMPLDILSYFRDVLGLPSDGSVVGYFQAGSQHYSDADQALTYAQQGIQAKATDLTTETVDGADPGAADAAGDQQGVGDDTGAYSYMASEVKPDGTAEAATRDVIRDVAELLKADMAQEMFDELFGREAELSLSGQEVAGRVLSRQPQPGSEHGALWDFIVRDILSTFGDSIEAAYQIRQERKYAAVKGVQDTRPELTAEDANMTQKLDALESLFEVYLGPQKGKPDRNLFAEPLSKLETQLTPFVQEYLKQDPEGKNLPKLLERYKQRIRPIETDPYGLAQPRNALPMSAIEALNSGDSAKIGAELVKLIQVKDALHGPRDVRLLAHQIRMVRLQDQFNGIFGMKPMDRFREVAKGVARSFTSNFSAKTDRIPEGALGQKALIQRWSLAAQLAADALNSHAMGEYSKGLNIETSPAYFLDLMAESVKFNLQRLHSSLSTNEIETDWRVKQYNNYLQALTDAKYIINPDATATEGDAVLGAKVRQFIDGPYKAAMATVLETVEYQRVVDKEFMEQAYWSPYLFARYRAEDQSLQFDDTFFQTTARVRDRYDLTLANPLSKGKILGLPDLVANFDEGVSQLIHAVSNAEFIDTMVDSGVFSLQQQPGYAKLNSEGAKKKLFDYNGTTYSTHEAAATAKKEQKVKKPIMRWFADVYAPAESAKYFNRITKPSGLRSTDLGRGLMALNTKLKMAKIVWSMFHRRSLLWSAMVGGPASADMGFAMSDLGDWKSLWNKIEHRFNYAARRDMGQKAIMQESPDVFASAFHGAVYFKALDLGESNIQYLTKLEKAIMSDHDSKAGQIGKNVALNVARTTRMFQNELFGRFATHMKVATFVNKLNRQRKHGGNAEKIAAEKLANNGEMAPWAVEYRKQFPDKFAEINAVAPETFLYSETENKIMSQVAGQVNADFGGLHWKRLGISDTATDALRLLFLGHDWTASNFQTLAKMMPFASNKDGGASGYLAADNEERMMYVALWARIAGRVALLTLATNLLMAGFDDEPFWKRLRKSWERGGLKWAMADISPIMHMIGGNQNIDHYLSIGGHYFDPVRWGMNPGRSVVNKSGSLTRPIFGAVMGSDHANRRPTPLHRIGKEGLRTWEYNRFQDYGPVTPKEAPAFLLEQLMQLGPIQSRNGFEFLSGQQNAVSAILQTALGQDVRRTHSRRPPVRQLGGGTPLRPSKPAVPYRAAY